MDRIDHTSTASAHRRPLALRPVLIGIVLAFVVGALLATYLARDGDLGLGSLFTLREDEVTTAQIVEPSVEPGALAQPLPSPSASQSAAAAAQAERVERVVEQAGGLDSRVAAMEQRLTRLDLQSQAAAGNAARAEGLLIAFASRRAIERGAPLGYLADQLRLRFGDSRPNAVAIVIDAAQEPITLAQLLTRLDGISADLLDNPTDESLLTRFGRELSTMFVVRHDDTPSPMAERRLERARLYLENGRIEAAVSEIRQLPNATIAADWLDDAERYGAAQRALETLETAAVLDPSELRDGEGTRVEQGSPGA